MDSKKWVIKGAAVLVAAVVVAVAMMFAPVDSSGAVVTDTNAAGSADSGVANANPASEKSAASNAPAKSAPVKEPEWNNVRETVTQGDIAFSSYPHVEVRDLEEGRYRVSYQADGQIKFVVYEEHRYDQWKSSGSHTTSKASTQVGGKCCSQGDTFVVDVNKGEAGKYYFVFDADKMAGQPGLAKSSTMTVTKING